MSSICSSIETILTVIFPLYWRNYFSVDKTTMIINLLECFRCSVMFEGSQWCPRWLEQEFDDRSIVFVFLLFRPNNRLLKSNCSSSPFIFSFSFDHKRKGKRQSRETRNRTRREKRKKKWWRILILTTSTERITWYVLSHLFCCLFVASFRDQPRKTAPNWRHNVLLTVRQVFHCYDHPSFHHRMKSYV